MLPESGGIISTERNRKVGSKLPNSPGPKLPYLSFSLARFFFYINNKFQFSNSLFCLLLLVFLFSPKMIRGLLHPTNLRNSISRRELGREPFHQLAIYLPLSLYRVGDIADNDNHRCTTLGNASETADGIYISRFSCYSRGDNVSETARNWELLSYQLQHISLSATSTACARARACTSTDTNEVQLIIHLLILGNYLRY